MRAKTYHFVAVIGGAIAGSVAAEILADSGIHAVVIEQNKRPYGKIEDASPAGTWSNANKSTAASMLA